MLSVDPTEIAILGEFTTAGGPTFDDYFLVIVTWDGRLTEVPMGQISEADFAWLRSVLEAPVEARLVNSTDLTSRIMFPPVLAGEPLFEFREEKLTWKSFLRRARSLWLVSYVEHVLTERALHYLAANPR